MFGLCLSAILTIIVLLVPTAQTSGAIRDLIGCRLTVCPDGIRATFEYPAAGVDSIEFEIPDWAGIDSFGVFVDSVQVVSSDGRGLPVVTTDRQTWMVAVSKMPFVLSYKILCPTWRDSSDDQQTQFLASVGPERFFFWGHSVVLAPLNDSLNALGVNVTAAAVKGQVLCSRDLSAPVKNLEDLSETVFVGGEYEIHRSTIMGAEVTLCRQPGIWVDSQRVFLEAVESILKAQARYMQSFPNKRLLIVVNRGTSRSSGGTAIPDAIVFFVDPAKSLSGSNYATAKLIAHESFHLWNGWKIHPTGNKPEGYFKWFHEGITDYYAYLTLYREGMISASQFIEAINGLLNLFAQNPLARVADADYFAENYWSDYRLQRLAYVRGAILGFSLDLMIDDATGGARHLDDVIRSLLSNSDVLENGYDLRTLAKAFNDVSGNNMRPYLGRYALGAELPDIDLICRAHNLECVHDSTPLFDIGFSIGEGGMIKGAEIMSVEAGSNAEAAGVKAGDVLVGWSYRTGEPEQTATFKLARGKEELMVSYQPARRQLVTHVADTEVNRTRIERVFDR